MPDPGSGGGGQISRLILDDGKSPKGLVFHLCRADILQIFLFGCLSGALEIRLAPNKTFSPFTPPSPLLSLHPKSGMQHHVQNFPFPLTISRITWSLWLRSCSGLLLCTSLLSLNFEPSLDRKWLRVFCVFCFCKECWDNSVQVKSL